MSTTRDLERALIQEQFDALTSKAREMYPELSGTIALMNSHKMSEIENINQTILFNQGLTISTSNSFVINL